MPADEALRPAAAAPSGSPRNVDSSTLVVCIDGPSGSGKSTVARGVARALGLRYLDTGAMYRALTWAVLERELDPENVGSVLSVADDVDLQMSTDPDRRPGPELGGEILVGGRDVSAAIRTARVTRAVSSVSAIPDVRRRMVALQRAIIGSGGIVVEGRDIGTAVCPDALVKIFLTASAEARAARRSAEELDAATARDLAAVKADLERRDHLDSTRVTSPLNQAADAVAIDSTVMDAQAVVSFVVELVGKRLGTQVLEDVGGERP